MILISKKNYYYVFYFCFLCLNESFENTLIWLLFADSLNLEFIYYNWIEIVLSKSSLNFIFSLFCFFLFLVLQLNFLYLKGYFLFEYKWIRKKIFWFLVKITIIAIINYIIFFNLFLPIEQSISNEIFIYSPSIIKFLYFFYCWNFMSCTFFLLIPVKRKIIFLLLIWSAFTSFKLTFPILLIIYLKIIITNDTKSNKFNSKR